MTTSKARYLVMPSRGTSGAAMQASIFRSPKRAGPVEILRTEIRRFQMATGGDSAARISETIDDADFEILSQRFDDGPVTVAMTDIARLALEVSNPGVRVLPITRYTLPGERGQGGAAFAACPSVETAVDAAGNVFMDDLKEYFLRHAHPGDEGDGILVGVLDTGVDDTHPALRGRVVSSRCFILGADQHAGRPVDWGASQAGLAGHGTHVAGIIAAAANAGGPAGVAPAARLVSYRIFPDNPDGPDAAENGVIIDSIRGAIDDGCLVINLSIEGATLKEDGVRTAIADA